jgi:hypothetical protein
VPEFPVGGLRLAYLASFLGISAGIYTLFARADDVVSAKTKKSFVDGLKRNAETETEDARPQYFAHMFDSVFGSRHFALRCFIRSCAASLFAVVFLFLLWAGTDQRGWQQFAQTASVNPVLPVVVTPILFNFLPDYISLLKSRVILSRLRGGGHTFLLLTFDLLASAGIAIVAILAGMLMFDAFDQYMSTGSFHVRLALVERVLIGPELQNAIAFRYEGGLPLCVFFYSTMLTSIWALLFVLSSSTLRASASAARLLERFFDLNKKPFSSVGFLSVILVAVIYVMALPFV